MSVETSIVIGVSSRVLANVACATNPRLGAAVVGCGTGFVVHQSWVKNTIQDPVIFTIIASGLVFDHYFFGGFEATITLLLATGLGVVLADFGPDLLYEVLGEQYMRDLQNLVPFYEDDPVSDYYDEDGGSVVSKASSNRTSRSGRTGTSVTARPSRPRVMTGPGSTITRSSRVTFDESSMAPSQSDDEYENGANGDGMYMEPSSLASGSTRTRTTMHPPSILRRMSMPVPTTATTTTSVPSEVSHYSRLSTESDMTARGHPRQIDEVATPYGLDSELQPPSVVFPEPELSSRYVYSPEIVPPSTNTPDMSASAQLSEQPQFIPDQKFDNEYEHIPPPSEPREPSILEQMMHVPIHDPHSIPGNEHLDAPPTTRTRSRSPSPARPASDVASPHVDTPPTAVREALEEAWVTVPEPFVRDDYEDRTVDVRKLDRESALQKIEEAWKTVENRNHRRLNVLVKHDDDIQSRTDSNFHLMEDLERARFNFKQRPGLFIITSRSRR